jgi:hypothetical protein
MPVRHHPAVVNMNATQMLEIMNRTPFEPFILHLNNGTVIHVEQPFSIAARPNSSTCIVFDDDGIARFVAYRNIAEVVRRIGTGPDVTGPRL